jgi:transcriptional regulator with XRE-family HTH domain
MLSVREARLLAGLTQAELAARAATSRTAVAAIESGGRTPSPELLHRLLEATGVRPSLVVSARRQQLLAILERYEVTDPRLAGSAASGTDGLDSDLDLVVHLPGGFGGLRLAALGDDLEAALGVRVDVISDRAGGPIAERILASAVPL